MHDKHMQTQHDRSAMNNMNSSHPHEGVAALTASAQQQEVTSSRPRGCFCNSRTLQAVCEGLACDCDQYHRYRSSTDTIFHWRSLRKGALSKPTHHGKQIQRGIRQTTLSLTSAVNNILDSLGKSVDIFC